MTNARKAAKSEGDTDRDFRAQILLIAQIRDEVLEQSPLAAYLLDMAAQALIEEAAKSILDKGAG